MSDLEFVGRMNPQPFISMAKEEKMRVEAIKKRRDEQRAGLTSTNFPHVELKYEREFQDEF